ncbi:uncharacterized protein LOC117917126 [Vitis riparia]|uniref:uncharacterized protein LOC117917126 n=1 Tax=Vitis riparia TaxID=96939 RepID=UPI00155B0D34|nr:uncharacterized protein LOC117917126 [Vitis riparia]
MASAKSQPLPTLSLSCLKLERNNPRDTNCSDSESKNQNNLGTDNVENGMSYTWGEVLDEKPTKLKIVIHRGEKKLKVASEQGMGGEGHDQKESGQRTWNLRPRTAVRKHFNAIRGQSGISNPICNILETTKKQEKPKKFLITLTWEEIEADFLAMTGSKPPRKPKRRPKNVQNVIDNLAPGLWLHEVNPSSYECKGSKSHN